MSDLLSAVDALTKPDAYRVTQDILKTKLDVHGRPVLDDKDQPIREVKGSQTVTVKHNPLLQQLEEAIASTIGAGAGRSMLERHALNVLDSDALYQFSVITSTIGDWCRTVHVRPTRNAVHDLRAWYVARLTTRPTDDDWHTDQLHSWAVTIRAKLNPWQKWEIKDPCPKCHESTWVDLDDQGNEVELPRPILIEYPVDRDEILSAAKASCRRCGFEWRGSSALRSLRWDTDHPDTPTENSDDEPATASTGVA